MKMHWYPGRRGLGAVLVALLGLVGAIYLGVEARRTALDTAARAVLAEMAPLLGQAVGDTPQTAARRLIQGSGSSPGLVFVTVRAPDHRVVASDGAWSAWFSGRVSHPTARTWRAWAYRLLCADARRPIAGGAQAHIGVSWWYVVVSAGPAFWLTIVLAIFGGLMSVRESRGQAATVDARSRLSGSAVEGRRDGARRSRALALKVRLMSARVFSRRAPTAGGHRKSVAGPGGDAGFQPIGLRAASAVGPPSPIRTARPETPDTTMPVRHPEPGATPEHGADDIRPVPVDNTMAGLEPDRLHLGFQPIWCGVREGLLVGGAVRFVADSATGSEPIPIDRLLAAEARDPQARRELARWIARRLTTLQANWRTLELPRVPLMVRLPEALFAFEQADTVWSDALARCQPEPGELVFCVERLPAAGRTLPVRWAVLEATGRDGAACYRLQAGAADEPALEREGADGERFVWPDTGSAGQEPSRLLAPCDFARLMSRCDLAPI